MFSERIGVDESGKGDFFGPLVIAACYVGSEEAPQLEGVKDCKKITDKKVIELAVYIKEICPHSIVAIGPVKYNELYKKFANLNRLLEWGHARAIENVLEKRFCPLVISDQFANPEGLRKALFQKGRQVELISRVRAEEDIAVAAASILARAEFLRRLKVLEEEFHLELPKGAGPKVLEAGKKFVHQYGPLELNRVAKMHFRTAQEVLLGK
jgi:ribonuclease HIII